MVQLWVNLPAKYKMSTPKYQELVNEKMGKFVSQNKDVKADVIAGELKGIKGSATTFTPINLYNLYMNEGADFEFELPANYNTGILVIEGTVVVNQTSKAEADNFILFKNDGESIHLSATENAKLLVLNGEAINEPIVPYGPFLMNTKEEIMQAYNDFNTGKFGVLED